MKKPFLIALILLIAGVVQGQNYLNPGDMSVSGNVSFSSRKYEKDQNRHIDFIGESNVFYYINSHFGIGASIYFQAQRTSELSVENSKWGFDRWGFGPALRYYFIPESGKLQPFTSLGYYLSRVKYSHTSGSLNSYDFSFGLGLGYQLSQTMSLEGQLRYLKARHVQKVPQFNDFKINSSAITFSIGLSATIPRD